MSSILTNTAAMTALKSLQMTQEQMQITQGRISTGQRVASASDNAAYWSIATTMRSDVSALSGVKDALGLGSSTIDVASAGTTSALTVTQSIKDKLVAALQPGVDRTKVQAEIKQLQGQLKSVADSSSFSGQNWLSVDSGATGYNATRSVVASFTRSGSTVSVGTIDVSVTGTKLFDATGQTGILDKVTGTVSVSTLDISALTDSAADQTTLKGLITQVDTAISSMTTSASNLGAAKTRITTQKDFLTSLTSALQSGIGTLVDADMTEESTKLQALQVQQQLGTQALSIANQSSQSILSLFR